MEKINIAFHSMSFLLALLAGFLLLMVNQERKHSNRLLAFILIFFAIQNLIFILLFTRLILELPWLIRLAAPTTFLLAPAAYLYTRSVLNDELTFRKKDWLFLIPAVLTLVNFIPYYLLPAQEKINYLNDHFYGKHQTQDAGRGIIPSKLYYVIRICWSAIFIILSFRMIYRFREKNAPDLLSMNRILLRWLFVFNMLLTSVLLATVVRVLIPTIKNTELTVGDIMLGGTILLICLYLFIRPQILYGLYQPLSAASNTGNVNLISTVINEPQYESPLVSPTIKTDEIDLDNNSIHLDPEQQLRFKIMVEKYFNEKKPYLNTEYSLDNMVFETKIPRYLLSAFINREYGMGFREFLNRYRVSYFKENLSNPEWTHLTLEAIAKECGFNSRSGFIFNFKKIAGQTPSEYISTVPGRHINQP
jgi:AraC-like DNA-binding protein